MFREAFFPDTALVFEKLKTFSFIKDYYLAGGTSLSLQLGHRKSIDLDFFIGKLPSHENILNNLKNYQITILPSDETGLNVTLNNTKVSFLQYPYPLETFHHL